MVKSEVDILAFHEEIITSFNNEEANLKKYQENLRSLAEILKNCNLLHSTRHGLIKAQKNLHVKINEIITSRNKNFYLMETAELITTYEEILRKPKKVSFMGVVEENDDNKTAIIQSYLEVARKYKPENVPILVTENRTKDCSICKKVTDIVDIDGFSVCTVCGKETSIAASSSSYKDVERVNVGSKYTYDKRIHFRDCMNQYQGKQNSTIPQKVYTALEKQFELHGLLNKSGKRNERFKRITKNHVLLFLKETGNSKTLRRCGTNSFYFNWKTTP